MMLNHFGNLNWWPGETEFEIIIGAVLTQNTSWTNVEKSISLIKEKNLMSPQALYALSIETLSELVRSSGYFNQKAKKIKHFLQFFNDSYSFDIEKMKKVPLDVMRKQLLGLHGIGPETADSILLYALSKPVFVVDAYTKRIFSRHGFINQNASYDDVQIFFEKFLNKDISLYNQYHALIVNTGKYFCTKKPKCQLCPLKTTLYKKSVLD
ncbi:endonuclease III domain-containing protein [bacterium]|nr:endonuclease III domain-containing protein [bacterium]